VLFPGTALNGPSKTGFKELQSRAGAAFAHLPDIPLYSVPQNSFPLPAGSIFSFATIGSALGKDYAGAIVTLFFGTL
jgi:hypothetical protein